MGLVPAAESTPLSPRDGGPALDRDEPDVTVEISQGFAELSGEIDALAERADAGPFVRRGWFEAWTAAFGGAERLHVVTVRRDGELVASIPLLRRRRGAFSSPTNWHTPAFGPIAVDDSAAGTLATAVVERAPALLDVAFVAPESAFASQLVSKAHAEGRLVVSRPVLRSPYVALEGTFESYEGNALSSKFRREIRRRTRKLEEHGKVEIAFEDGSERLAELLDEGFAVEGSGWKDERGTAIASSPETERFYRDVAAWAQRSGWLQLGFLRLDGRAVAFMLAIARGGEVDIVKVGFDPDWRKYGPGSILTRAAIERAYEQGMTRYDFLGGEDAYKLDWTDAVGERVRIQAFGRNAYGLAGYLAWRWGRPVAKRALELGRERSR